MFGNFEWNVCFALWVLILKSYIFKDRCGEKPLYYGKSNNGIIFGSELKIFREFPFWNKQIDMESISMFMKYGYPISKFHLQNIKKLTPGHYLVIRNNLEEISEPVCFWDSNNLNK